MPDDRENDEERLARIDQLLRTRRDRRADDGQPVSFTPGRVRVAVTEAPDDGAADHRKKLKRRAM